MKRLNIVFCVICIVALPILLNASSEYEEKIEKLMKDVRLAYKSIKIALRDNKYERAHQDSINLLKYSKELILLEPDSYKEDYKRLSQEFKEQLERLNTYAENKKYSEFEKEFNNLKQNCKSCHKYYKQFIYRLVEEVLL